MSTRLGANILNLNSQATASHCTKFDSAKSWELLNQLEDFNDGNESLLENVNLLENDW